MSNDPLKGGAPDDDSLDGKFHDGMNMVRRVIKRRTPTPPSGLKNRIGRRPEGSGPPYDTRDVGGTDFQIGVEFGSAYEAIRINASGDVAVETAGGDRSIIAADGSGNLEEITVKKILADDTTVAASEIVLYR